MPLPPRTRRLDALHAVAAAKGYRVVAGAMDADQGEQAQAFGGKVLRQAADLDVLSPPGYFCRHAPEDEQVVMPCDGGDVVVGHRPDVPADVAARPSSLPTLYDDQGQRLELNGNSGVRVLVKTGQKLKVHKGGTAKAAALSGDDVFGTEAFIAWLNNVAGAAGWPTPWPTVPAAKIATVTASSSTLEAE